jgi:hypothetical protein
VIDPWCEKTPDQIQEYIDAARENDTTPEEYVRTEEATYNPENGHFCCTACYIAIGMPSRPGGWKAP